MGKHHHRYCAAKQAEIAALNVGIAQLNSHIAQQTNQLQGLSAQSQALTNTVAVRDTKIQQLTTQIQQLTDQNQEQSQSIAARDRTIEQLKSLTQQLNEQKNLLETEKKELEQLLELLNSQYDSLVKSKGSISPIKATKSDVEKIASNELATSTDQLKQISLDKLLIKAAEESNEALARQVISKGANLNFCDELKNSVLHKACAANAVEIVKLLLVKGCKVNVKNNKHQVPMQLTRHAEIKTLLFAAGQKERIHSATLIQRQMRKFLKAKAFTPDKPLRNLASEIKSNSINNFSPEKDRDLVAALPLKGDAKDASDNHNHGTIHDAQLCIDRFNQDDAAFYFDGASYIKGRAHDFPRGDRSISLWFQADANEGKQCQGGTLYSQTGKLGDASANLAITLNHGLGSGLNTTNNLSIYSLGKYDKEICYVAEGQTNFSNWNHLVMTSKSGEGTTLYLNGQSVAHSDFFYSTDQEIQTFALGTFLYDNQPTNYTTDPMFTGALNELMIYKRALTAAEVNILYQRQRSKPETKHQNADKDIPIEELMRTYLTKNGSKIEDFANFFKSAIPFFAADRNAIATKEPVSENLARFEI